MYKIMQYIILQLIPITHMQAHVTRYIFNDLTNDSTV